MKSGEAILSGRELWAAGRHPAAAAHHPALLFLVALTLFAQISCPVPVSPRPSLPLPRLAAPLERAAPVPAQPPLLPPAGFGGGAPSPTGRTPKLLWTPQQQSVWNKMREDHDPWFEYLKSSACPASARDGASRTSRRSR